MRDVKVGFITLTEVTSGGSHAEINAWHQLDHLPEQYAIPGVSLGQRWVLAPACKEAQVAVEDPFPPFHYMSMYLMTEPLQQTLDEFMEVRDRLVHLGRFYEHRSSPLTGAYVFLEALASSHALVGPEIVPFRPNLGIYVMIDEPRPDDPSLDEYLEQRHASFFPRLLEEPGVAGIWSFGNRLEGTFTERLWAMPQNKHASPQDAYRITVVYLDEDPLSVADSLGALAQEHWKGAPVRPHLAAPFLTITPWKWDWFDAET